MGDFLGIENGEKASDPVIAQPMPQAPDYVEIAVTYASVR